MQTTKTNGTMRTSTKQIEIAKTLGKEAFNNNIKCIPALDSNLLGMLIGRMPGQTPKGEASTKRLMKSWSHSWLISSLNS